MTETFKIVWEIYGRGKYDQEFTQEIFQSGEDGNTKGNSHKCLKSRAWLNLKKHAFSNRVVNNQHSLPDWVTGMETMKKVETGLDKYWKNHGQIVNQKEETAALKS